MSSTTKTSFTVMVTFDSSAKHKEITAKLNDSQIYTKSLSNNKLPNNTYIGVIEGMVALNDKGSFETATLRDTSEKIAKNLRKELKDFFNESDLDGKVYVLVSWHPVTGDSVTR